MTDELSRLFAAERAATPPAQLETAGLERLLTSLAAQTAPLPVAVGALKLGASLVTKWLGVGFAVGMAGAGAAAQWAPAAPAAAPSAALAASAPPKIAPSANSLEALVPAPSAAVEAEAPVRPSVVTAARSSPAQNAPSASPSIDEELRLIRRAKQDLDGGRPHLSEVWLDEHRRRFPNGVFGLDREGLSILARCSHRPDPTLANDFAARHPGSPLVGQLRRKCGAESPPAGTPTTSGDFSGSDK